MKLRQAKKIAKIRRMIICRYKMTTLCKVSAKTGKSTFRMRDAQDTDGLIIAINQRVHIDGWEGVDRNGLVVVNVRLEDV